MVSYKLRGYKWKINKQKTKKDANNQNKSLIFFVPLIQCFGLQGDNVHVTPVNYS